MTAHPARGCGSCSTTYGRARLEMEGTSRRTLVFRRCVSDALLQSYSSAACVLDRKSILTNKLLTFSASGKLQHGTLGAGMRKGERSAVSP